MSLDLSFCPGTTPHPVSSSPPHPRQSWGLALSLGIWGKTPLEAESETRPPAPDPGSGFMGARSQVSGMDAATGTAAVTPTGGADRRQDTGAGRTQRHCGRVCVHMTSTPAGKLIASLLVPTRDQPALAGPQGSRVHFCTKCQGDRVCWSARPVSHIS